ncbi:hypothetical protein GGR50DRAFT_98127 [Xylaria sp. CBS 124048]|nr:hypothetical protein GGR50DRAFT_98127 [Xylaria sp. CBS 124048]
MGEDDSPGLGQHGAEPKQDWLHPQQPQRNPPFNDNSSFVETTRLEPDDEHHVDSITEEQHVRAHLLDVESSFLPPTSPTIQVTGPDAGVDDTYLFDITSRKQSPRQQAQDDGDTVDKEEENDKQQSQQPNSQAEAVSVLKTPDVSDTNQQSGRESLTATPTPAARHTPSTAHATPDPIPTVSVHSAHPEISPLPDSQSDCTFADDSHATDATLALENLSSPTTAAAARAVSRAASAAANSTAHELSGEHGEGALLAQDSSNMEDTRDTDDGATLAHAPNPDYSNSEITASAVSTDAGAALGNASRNSQRPRYLHSRTGSHRSSSSFLTSSDDVESDVTVGMGADYALHSGGAAPAFGLTPSASRELSRSISIGSMASGMDDSLDSIRQGPLEPLQEVDSPIREHAADALVTPKANRGPLKPPTDTAIARHVRNVEVPESLAQEYQNKGGLSTPLNPYPKPSDFTSAPNTSTRNGRSMTLKEQSSTIDRLSKENFDLKLKVMFLSDRLDKLSEEGIKEMISENVELRTTLAVLQRDNKVLRRRAKDLEKRLRDEEDRPSTARSGFSSEGRVTPSSESGAQTHEEELIHMREQIEEYVREIERLRSDNMAGEMEKRKLVETVKTMGDRATDRAGDALGRQEEADVWKDLLEQETARREQADEENRALREEIFQLRQETNGSVPLGGGSMQHTTNIYNITRKPRQSSPSRSRPLSRLSGEADQSNTFSQSSTLVEELRRESEKLRHENAELRREVGAQTSMLTSRNREKERLYQEIEDLKLAQRRGGPAPSTLDSLLDRSASRSGANDRPISRGSGLSRLTMTVEEDPEREELENKIAEQRDKINELKFKNQELQRDVETYLADLEDATEGKRQAEEQIAAIQDDLDNTMNDLMIIQAERDEALEDQTAWEGRFNDLRIEAQTVIDELENEADQQSDEINKLRMDLQDRSENFEALQEEMRRMTDSLIKLEDEQAKTQKRIEQLEQELTDSSKELEDLEAQLLEANEKGQRLGVQQESSQGEIAFLREEQESDKIRIGDLEAAVANAEQVIANERDRVKELDQRLADERKQWELTSTREKAEAQQVQNDLNREASSAKEEARLLRKSLGNREVEATQWKERLMELENNLREALGDLNGTRSSLLQSIATLQRELETTVRELDTTRSSLLEKERMIKQRDSLLETHALESRKLGDLLDKERQAHRITKNQFETFERTHQHVSRTVTSQDSRIVELETTRATDKRRIAQLEATFKEQLVERNNLLLMLWTRLSMLCGSDWAHDNSLINGRALPSLESISTMLPGFSKNLLAAIKMIETLLGNFQSRIKSVERDLWKDYHALENTLDSNNKKIERLEALVRSGVASGGPDALARLTQLESAYRALKIENATLQRARDARTRGTGYGERTSSKLTSHGSSEDLMDLGSPSPSVPTGPGPGPYGRESRLPRSVTTHLEPTSSKSRASSASRNSSNTGAVDLGRGSSPHGDSGPSRSGDQQQWLLRLRELESKLKEEREARMMDRAAARQRIQDSERQNSELAAELIRAKRKAE